MDLVEILSHRERLAPAVLVHHLYDDLGWWPERTVEKIASVLEGATAVGAWDGDELVGFARAVTDGRFRAYVEDVAVDARYRRRGIGTMLVTRLLVDLAEIETISLFCERGLAGFYEGRGFRATSQVVLHRTRVDGQ